jgi:antitoxin VapB
MDIIGCDLHTRYQVVAWVDQETGEILTRRLEHENGEARTFYARLPHGAVVGIEATFPALWFERLLAEPGSADFVPFKVCGYRDPCFRGLTFRALLYIMVYIPGEEGLIMRQKAKVFTNGRSQAVRLPAAFRFDTKEVFIDRNPRTGDVILSRKPANWREVFAALDRAGVPEDLLADRDRSLPQERETV